jgi:hypothetical protein
VFAIQAQRAGTKISPARKGWVHRQAVERRRCGTTLLVCSLGAKPRDLSTPLRSGRDDKGEGRRFHGERPRTEGVAVQQPLFMEPLPFPLSSRGAKPRDLRFRGPLLEARNTIRKQNCHLACPGVPWDRTQISCHAALDIAACAAFVKESSMKCANATSSTGNPGGRSVVESLPRCAVGSAVFFYFSRRFLSPHESVLDSSRSTAATRFCSAALSSKHSTSYIVKKPIVPPIWTPVKFSRPCGTHFAIGSHARTSAPPLVASPASEQPQPRPADADWDAVSANRPRSVSGGKPSARDTAFPSPQSQL